MANATNRIKALESILAHLRTAESEWCSMMRGVEIDQSAKVPIFRTADEIKALAEANVRLKKACDASSAILPIVLGLVDGNGALHPERINDLLVESQMALATGQKQGNECPCKHHVAERLRIS